MRPLPTSLRALVPAAILAGSLLQVSPALALSCAADPPDSPWAFEGVVQSTSREGREARVLTEDGRIVIVHGSPVLPPGVTHLGERTFRSGHRYRFHPSNATSPYNDMICSATEDITGAPTQAPTPAPQAATSDAPESNLREVLPAAGALVALGVIGLIWRARRA